MSMLLGKEAYLEDWNSTITSAVAGGSKFDVNFDFEEEIGLPGAFLIKNNHYSEFYLKTLTLEHVPGHDRLHFVCGSWVYPDKKYDKPRVFFTNKTYLPHEMPKPLLQYTEQELMALRSNGQGELQEWDRVYDYAYYNDLGNPDKGPNTPARFSEDLPSTPILVGEELVDLRPSQGVEQMAQHLRITRKGKGIQGRWW
ncbi:linoleate 9S-lipoxygenase 1-like isoform X2 [Gossypium hirsutum]|uniref:Linoleate 9S-lipoxygenase 1-like isoform X2 n=1 Tax=Gossypium hirsutum TaxID=3635 RepID=A0ABM2ZQA7_GOSHI|nr:linoleate 9S-lipoxygenase 1-like isoform X2 [Gossypium hirsutum]